MNRPKKNCARIAATGDAKEISQAEHWLEVVQLALMLSESLVARESLDFEIGYDEPPKILPICDPQRLKGH